MLKVYYINKNWLDISDFSNCIQEGLAIMSAYAKKIENAKLRAICQRNMVQSENESCDRKQAQLNALLKEKQEELEKYFINYYN